MTPDDPLRDVSTQHRIAAVAVTLWLVVTVGVVVYEFVWWMRHLGL